MAILSSKLVSPKNLKFSTMLSFLLASTLLHSNCETSLNSAGLCAGLILWQALRVVPVLGAKKGKMMSILARFSPPSMTADQYDAIVARLYKEGIHPADGLELEVCFGSGDQMKVSILFDSMAAFERFGERLQPILQELGMDPGTPDIMDVHHVIRRGV
jgi:hypothetical protein